MTLTERFDDYAATVYADKVAAADAGDLKAKLLLDQVRMVFYAGCWCGCTNPDYMADVLADSKRRIQELGLSVQLPQGPVQ